MQEKKTLIKLNFWWDAAWSAVGTVEYMLKIGPGLQPQVCESAGKSNQYPNVHVSHRPTSRPASLTLK